MAQLPIGQFLTTRLKEYDSKFELRKGTGFEQLFFKPMEFILQPFRDEANDMFIGQSFKRILEQPDPDAFDEEAVDALASNMFVSRREGGFSGGVGRVYYNEPVDREYPANGAVFTGSNSQTYINPSPFKITASEMSAQIEDGLYYFDIPLQSQEAGAGNDLAEGELVSLVGDTEYVTVTNKLAFENGVDREKNTEFINRVKESIGVRDVVTGKGFNAILFENFVNFLREVQPIGFGDDELMRDIVYNTHIGGKVDGYIKTSSIKRNSKNFIGILIDPTRQTSTSKNVQLIGTAYAPLGQPNVDRSNNLLPIVKEIKVSVAAQFVSTLNVAPPVTLNLSTTQHVMIGIDGFFKNVRIAGVVPSATTRNEVINLINGAFGVDVASISGNFIKIKSPTSGLASQVVIDNPTVGNSALLAAFGLNPLSAPFIYNGDGPVTYEEGVHYEVDDGTGRIKRLIGTTILAAQINGETTINDTTFVDNTLSVFLNVNERDILTITSGPDAGDYRILVKQNNNTLILDKQLTTTATGVTYEVKRTGIKSGEVVYVTFWFNPLSIDIGRLVRLDSLGKDRGIRTGREEWTITDGPVLRIVSIEEIDPLTFEPTGTVLSGEGGYGRGGFGRGVYGVGSSADYRLIVNYPHEHFSMFDDSYIVINKDVAGLSYKVTYDYVPEIESIHNFVRSETERNLDSDILIKHFLPAYVSGTIQYSVDATDSSIPDNDSVQTIVRDFITTLRAGNELQYSDIIQLITKTVDPYSRYGSFVKPFQLKAIIHNCDGTTTKISGTELLAIPETKPFPKDTKRPLSPRIAHWIASDELVLERI